MKAAVLGANWPLSAEAIFQAVVPATGLPSPSVQSKAAPPHAWTSIPRCRLYQACSAGASLALKKMPPMPVTRFIESPRLGEFAGLGEGGVCGGVAWPGGFAAEECCRDQGDDDAHRQRFHDGVGHVDEGVLVELLGVLDSGDLRGGGSGVEA